jgi:hypothetical protein
MVKEEVVQQFIENDVERKSLESLLALEEYFQMHKDALAQGFIQSFKQLCLKIKEMQAQGEKDKIGYITYSMLRTEILEGRHMYLLEASDSTWFFDRKECQVEYDASWAFQFLDRLESELEKKGKTYMGAITKPDIEKIKLREAGKYNQYVVSLAQYAMSQATALPEYLDIEREEELEVRVGEYLDISEIVYKEDTRIKDSVAMKEWLEEKLEYEYAYEVFSNLDLSQGDYEGIDLRYADLKQSNVSESNLRGCILLGAKFTHCHLQGTDFSHSLISEADFSQSNLKGAVFRDVEGLSGLTDPTYWEMPGLAAVNFEGADLEGADFENANLKGAVFVGANLTATNFKGANLENAVFSMEDIEKIKLDSSQRESIILKF